MNKFFASVALAVTMISGTAMADTTGVYVEPKLGLAVVQSQEARDSKANIEWGAVFGYDFGANYTLPVRAELEWLHSGHKTFTMYNEGKVGVSRDTLMLNALYDIDVCPVVTPYVGAGMGIAWTRTSADVHHTNPGFAADLIAGVSKKLDENWVLDFQARYTFAGMSETQTGAHHQKGARFLAGVRYTF